MKSPRSRPLPALGRAPTAPAARTLTARALAALTLAAPTLAITTLAAEARASVVAYEDVEAQARAADAVMLARVVEVRRGEAETRVRLEVERWLGAEGPAEAWLVEPGGAGAIVSGAPSYRVGERVLVMAMRRDDGAWQTRGLSAGRYVVQPTLGSRPPRVLRDLRDLTMVRWDAAGMQAAEGGVERFTLPALIARVLRAGAEAP
jgi:hypothetical protein